MDARYAIYAFYAEKLQVAVCATTAGSTNYENSLWWLEPANHSANITYYQIGLRGDSFGVKISLEFG